MVDFVVGGIHAYKASIVNFMTVSFALVLPGDVPDELIQVHTKNNA